METAAPSPCPIHIEIYHGFNIFKYGVTFYGIPQGEVDVDILSAEGRECCFTLAGLSVEEVRRSVDQSSQVLVQEGYKGFNIYQYMGRTVALSQSLGAVDMCRLDSSVIREYQERGVCIINEKHRAAAIPPRSLDENLIRQRVASLVEALRKQQNNESARNIEYLINSFEVEEIGRVMGLQGATIDLSSLLTQLADLQKDRIRRRLDPDRKTIAIYFPGRAYRGNVGNIASALRRRGYNTITFIGTVCDDRYEEGDDVFYGGHNIISQMDFVDIFICPTLTDGLPKRSTKVLFVHDIHDSPLGDEGEFLDLLRHFDYVFLPSHYVVDAFRTMLSKIEVPSRLCLIKGGYVKLDRNIEYFRSAARDEKTLIYAPTVTLPEFAATVSLPEYGDRIIDALLENFPNYKIIFRPHPHTMESDYVAHIRDKHGNNPRFIMDDDGSFYMENYSRAALMITDMSGTAFTYAFTTLRPVLFFSHNEAGVKEQLGHVSYFKDRIRIGYVAEDIGEMTEKVRLLLKNRDEFTGKIKEFRDSLIYNIGKAEECFSDNISYIVEKREHPDWVYL